MRSGTRPRTGSRERLKNFWPAKVVRNRSDAPEMPAHGRGDLGSRRKWPNPKHSLAAVPTARSIADNLSKAGWSWGCVSAVDSEGRTIFVADEKDRIETLLQRQWLLRFFNKLFKTRVAAQRIPERQQFQLTIARAAWTADDVG